MKVGIVYDLFQDYPDRPGDPFDASAENEPEETVLALESALRALGHDPVRIGTPAALFRALPELDVDAAVNIAEGAWSRNREGWAPTLLEMAGIPYLGSDALTLSLSLDKAWTKDLAEQAGVPTPRYRVYDSPGQIDALDLPGPFPLFAKPRYEGSAKGLSRASRVEDVPALEQQVREITQIYAQPAIVEAFVDGGEFTVAVFGNNPARAMPVLQRGVEPTSGIGVHVLERPGLADAEVDYELRGDLTPDLEAELKRLAVRVYEKLDCRDFARLDFRTDSEGAPWFLEINPLPTFAPDGTFAILAELAGQTYAEFLAEVLRDGLARALNEAPRRYL